MAEQELGSAAFAFGPNAQVGDITVKGHVVGRDLNIAAQEVNERAQLLEMLTELQKQVQALADVPAGPQQDAIDDLNKARAAGEQWDDSRLIEKLESARGFLERIGSAAPTAIALAQTIATLVQRVPGLS